MQSNIGESPYEPHKRSDSDVILGALQNKTIYAGTANPKTVAKRRAKNKVAGASRRVNRSRR